MNKLYYAVQNKHKEITLKSGSGGMFYAISKYVLNKKGTIYGASFMNDFRNVEIIRVDSLKDIDKLLTSKYLLSSVKNSFSLVKKDLDESRLVLFSGLPCQIHALKAFLKQDYDNLLCVEIVCHGTLSSTIWNDYLDSIKSADKKITSINMRDKRFGWNDYGMSIKYDDNSEFFEKHQDNKYMKAFLSDKYLNKSCYDCKFKNEYSKADLSIGDFWGATKDNTSFEKSLGINVVVTHTEKGLEILNNLEDIDKKELTKELASKWNGGMSNKINVTPATYDKSIFNKSNKIGILTLNFNDNIGGVLQSYALQKFLGDNFYSATTIQSHDYWHHLSFVKKLKIKTVTNFSNIRYDFDSYIVGSDQVWRRDFISGKWAECWKSWRPLFLDFAKDWNVNKIAYSASYGTDEFKFNDVITEVKQCLNKFDAISMREIDATNHIKKLTDRNDVINTCDPTMLLKKEDYISICKNIPNKESDLFAYILDKNVQIDNIICKANVKKMTLKQNSVEDWLACYRDCKCVVTDSYHGVVFSIIFNKPFICVYNKGRGMSRFNTLIELFNIKDRFVENEQEVNYKLLEECPNVDYSKLVELSKRFLLTNLENKERRQVMQKTSPVFGIVSWFPDSEPERTQRITRLNKMFKQLNDLFGEDIKYMIVAQNWKDYQLPDYVKADVFRYNKLGILGARKTLGKHFLESSYDYLIMCDDDIILKTSDSFTKEYFFDELNKHPNGFVFLKYGWSLTFCAISKYIYQQSPICDIDPEKGEGYEDTVWPMLLHYKHADKEFTLSGIEFIQNQIEFVKELKSTWCNKTTDHKKLHLLSNYHINQFKKGNYSINKKRAKELSDKYDWYKKAIFHGWCSRKEYDDFMKNFE